MLGWSSTCGLYTFRRAGVPRVKQTWGRAQAESALPVGKRAAYRAVAARSNFPFVIRQRYNYAAKEICRWVAKPTTYGVQALTRF